MSEEDKQREALVEVLNRIEARLSSIADSVLKLQKHSNGIIQELSKIGVQLEWRGGSGGRGS